MKKGDQVNVKILKIDHENRRISLGYKQLSDDPWPEIARKYSGGSDCLGTVKKVMDRGVVVDLDDNVEGFVPTAQLGHKDMTDATTAFKEGDQLPLQVLELDRGQRKVILSVVAYYKKRERAEFDDFLARHQPQSTTMGDAMPEELKAAAAEAAEAEQASPPEAEEKPAAAEEAPSEEPASEESTEPTETPADSDEEKPE
jgi:small subunit ribosomal protein S1